jgi:hypothetical protein
MEFPEKCLPFRRVGETTAHPEHCSRVGLIIHKDQVVMPEPPPSWTQTLRPFTSTNRQQTAIGATTVILGLNLHYGTGRVENK